MAEFVVKFNKKRGIGEHCTLHRTNKAEGARERSPWHVKDKVLFCRGRHWPFSAQGAFCSVLGGIKALTGQELLPRAVHYLDPNQTSIHFGS